MTMFNEQSVGRRVISNNEGKGTITKVTQREKGLEIRVDFDNYDAYSFSSKGKFLGLEYDDDEDIKYLIDRDNKQGSSDARRIVAMLAVEYRKLSLRIDKSGRSDNNFLLGRESQAAKLYLKAKQLLTEESNERI